MFVNIDAEKLKQLRESRCWSQQQLADLSGLSLRTVQRIEARSVASQESVKCLAATFDVPAQTLLKTSADDADPEKNNDSPANDDPVLVSDSSHQASDTSYQQQSRTLYLSFAVVFVSHLFGFYGIFSAFDEGTISESTFQILKNSLSIVLIVSAVILFFKDKQLKKKYFRGSSL